MSKSNLKINEDFNFEDGACAQVFLYDDNGRYKGVNEKPFTEAAKRLLAKIKAPKERYYEKNK